MANAKTGFPHYRVDTDRYQDIGIRRLKKKHGAIGIAVYDYLLCQIYREKGCYLDWDESTSLDVADYFQLDEFLVHEIVIHCAGIGLFNKNLLHQQKVLSSVAIQKRFIELSAKSRRSNVTIPANISLLEESGKMHEESAKMYEECGDTADIMQRNEALTSKMSEESGKMYEESPQNDSNLHIGIQRKNEFKEEKIPSFNSFSSFNSENSKDSKILNGFEKPNEEKIIKFLISKTLKYKSDLPRRFLDWQNEKGWPKIASDAAWQRAITKWATNDIEKSKNQTYGSAGNGNEIPGGIDSERPDPDEKYRKSERKTPKGNSPGRE